MIIYSHRGESKFQPENTMPAFYLAYLLKDDGIECDIRKTKDDVIVIIHDMTINRTSDKVGFIKNMTYDELRKINFKNNTKIVSLEDFLYYFSNKNIKLFIEIKEEGYEKEIVNLISKFNTKNITLISFNINSLKKVKKFNKNIKTGYLIFKYSDNIKKISKNCFIDTIILNSLDASKETIDYVKEDFKVSIWGIKLKSDILKFYECNVNSIIYNSGYLAKKYLEEHNA